LPLNRLPDYISSNISLTGVSADYLDGIDSSVLTYSLRANRNITGGGAITFDSNGFLYWSQRFIVISNGKSPSLNTDGYFDIYVPTSGTITGVGGLPNRNATGSGIQINVWEALYYILPLGQTSTAGGTNNFRIASYISDSDIPHNWILIAVRNGETGYLYLNNGVVLAPGHSSLAGLSTNILVGGSNSAFGYQALDANTSGTYNTAVGWNALGSNTIGGYNIAVGADALIANIGGGNNVAIGVQSLRLNTSGTDNIAIGYRPLDKNTTGVYNVGIGTTALFSTTGSNNTAIGTEAGYSLTSGSNNTIIGYAAVASSATVSNEITLGNGSVTSLRVPGISITAGTTSFTAPAFIPSSSTVPTNGMYLSAANTLNFATNTTNRMSIDSAGAVVISGTLTAGSSANKTTAYPVAPVGTTSGTVTQSAQLSGYIGLPQNAYVAAGIWAYSFGSLDAGKHIYVTGTPTSATITIPANSAVAFEIGTTIVIMNDLGAATNISIAITTDTLQLAGTGSTGTRTLARYGVASVTKVTSTKWIISGNGLT
jgi:hypothetical protein